MKKRDNHPVYLNQELERLFDFLDEYGLKGDKKMVY